MSFIINPTNIRLGYSRYWNNVWCLSKNINYSFLIFLDELIIIYLRKIIDKYWLKSSSFILSHIKIFRTYEKFNLFIFIRFQFFFFFDFYKYKWLIEKKKKFLINKKLHNIVSYLEKKKIKKKLWQILNIFKECSIFTTSQYRYQIIRKEYYDVIKIIFLYCLYFNNFLLSSFFNINPTIQNKLWKYSLLSYIIFFFLFKYYYILTHHYFLYIIKKFYTFASLSIIYMIFLPIQIITASFLTNYIKHRLNQNYTINIIIQSLFEKLYFAIKYNEFKGIKICVTGRFTRKERKLFYWQNKGKIGYSNINSRLDYNMNTIILNNSICGIKIWINQSVKLNQLFIF